ncbi:MAG: hypothetical protein Mars2KO_05160 [Maribacter sp.]
MSKNWKYPSAVNSISLNTNEEKTVRVCAKEYYSSVALSIKAGQQYRFEVDDKDIWVDFFLSCNAKGFRNIFLRKRDRRVRKVRCFHLCGTIGMNDDHNFPIGLETEYHVLHSGNLHFFANDKKDSWFANFNNFGCIHVNIARLE